MSCYIAFNVNLATSSCSRAPTGLSNCSLLRGDSKKWRAFRAVVSDNARTGERRAGEKSSRSLATCFVSLLTYDRLINSGQSFYGAAPTFANCKTHGNRKKESKHARAANTKARRCRLKCRRKSDSALASSRLHEVNGKIRRSPR